MSPGKRKPRSVVEAIFDDLEKGELKTFSEIANNIGSHYNTVRDYVELIMFIQGKPKISVEQTENMSMARVEKP
ncbi:MAG TPA: hypothetical protein VKM55_17405 [Candidatus Lokiarchaeia archaeon]|nr:hypothetical protein [Candidatus Lokiarchaeia archaeon]